MKRVIVGYQNEIAMGLDLEDALFQIFGDKRQQIAGSERPTGAAALSLPAARSAAEDSRSFAAQARGAYEAMQEASRRGDWTRFGDQMRRLGNLLQNLETEAR